MLQQNRKVVMTVDASQIKPTKDHARKIVELVDQGLCKGVGEPQPGKMCVEAAVCFAFGLPHGDNPPCVGTTVRSFKITLNDCNWSSDKARAKGLRRLAIAQLGSESINQALFVKEVALASVRLIVPIALRAAAKIHPDQKHKDSMEAAAVKCEQCEGNTAARYAAADDAADAAAAARYAAAAADARYAADAAADARYAANAAAAARYAAAAAADARYAASYAADAADAAAAASYDADAADAADAARDEVLGIMAEAAVQALIKCKSPGCEWLDLVPPS